MSRPRPREQRAVRIRRRYALPAGGVTLHPQMLHAPTGRELAQLSCYARVRDRDEVLLLGKDTDGWFRYAPGPPADRVPLTVVLERDDPGLLQHCQATFPALFGELVRAPSARRPRPGRTKPVGWTPAQCAHADRVAALLCAAVEHYHRLMLPAVRPVSLSLSAANLELLRRCLPFTAATRPLAPVLHIAGRRVPCHVQDLPDDLLHVLGYATSEWVIVAPDELTAAAAEIYCQLRRERCSPDDAYGAAVTITA